MALDLATDLATHAFPQGLTIAADNTSALDRVRDLPYAQVIIPRSPHGGIAGAVDPLRGPAAGKDRGA